MAAVWHLKVNPCWQESHLILHIHLPILSFALRLLFNRVLLLSCLLNRKLLPGGNHSDSSSSLVPMPATLSFRVWWLKRSTISEGELASSGFLSVLAEINLGKRMEIPRDGWTRPTPAWCTGDIVRSAFQQLTIEKMLLYLSSNIITNFQRVVFM